MSITALSGPCPGTFQEIRAVNRAEAAAHEQRTGGVPGTGGLLRENDNVAAAGDRAVYDTAITRSSSAVQAALTALVSGE